MWNCLANFKFSPGAANNSTFRGRIICDTFLKSFLVSVLSYLGWEGVRNKVLSSGIFWKRVLQNVQCLSTFCIAYLSPEKQSVPQNGLYDTTCKSIKCYTDDLYNKKIFFLTLLDSDKYVFFLQNLLVLNFGMTLISSISSSLLSSSQTGVLKQKPFERRNTEDQGLKDQSPLPLGSKRKYESQ